MIENATEQSGRTEMASEIVAAYVRHNSVPVAEVPNLIRSVYNALSSLGEAPATEAPAESLKPAVPVKKSVTDEYIISLEDGRKFKSLKRYLATSHGMTPAEYRAKWGLPADYPMVAPAYAAKRSELARSIGLGRKASKITPEVEPRAIEEATVEVSKKRGRAKESKAA